MSHKTAFGRKYQTRGQLSFSVKGQLVNTFRFIGHMVSLTTIEFCHYNRKAMVGNTEMNGRGCVPIKLYL